MKAKIPNGETSYAYTASSSKSQDAQDTQENKPGEYHYTKQPQNDSIEVWHHRFCHINTNTLRQTEKAVYGMKIHEKRTKFFFCKGCVFGKHHRTTYPTHVDKEL